MNVFEDLIVELKEENLLESTVIEADEVPDDAEFEYSNTVVEDERDDPSAAGTAPAVAEDQPTHEADLTAGDASDETEAVAQAEPDQSAGTEANVAAADTPDGAPAKPAPNTKEFFKKRAIAEVSSLQMVEHVLTGVEREYQKIVPNPFDDLNAKKALHSFLNVAEGTKSEEHAAAEFTLMQETEAWCTALGERDREIPVSSLRLYCENSRPALSSQALVALARFYRNLPYSEQVRAKFDFTITRLFSRPSETEDRVCLFNRDESLKHITTLYREWSSIPLYTADDDDSKVLLTALSFEDLAIEAESASTFDQLIESDFFGRLRLFKESISEMFFAPNVTAAAIECNIRIGNAYVKLLDLERQKLDDASIESKYGEIHDQTVSEAAARTLGLVELLRNRPAPSPTAAEPEELRDVRIPYAARTTESPVAASVAEPLTEEPASTWLHRLGRDAKSMNPWFMGAAVLLVAASVGIWMWSNLVAGEAPPTTGVETVAVDSGFMGEHIQTARKSEETLYAVLKPSWDVLPKEKRQEFLQQVLQAGKEKGYKQVNLISKDGKVAGFASPTRFDVVMP